MHVDLTVLNVFATANSHIIGVAYLSDIGGLSADLK